jgi:hypothetical protein
MKTASVVVGRTTKLFGATLLSGLLLASCGGGDPYAGLWLGTVGGNRNATAVVLDDGAYYVLYSVPGAPDAIAGMIQGTGDFHGATFSSTDARDFSWDGRGTQAATLSAKISPKMAVSGTVNAKPAAQPFSVSYQREFDDIARLPILVGSYAGTVTFILGTRPAVFQVSAAGDVSTSINGCPITGRVVPRNDANAYDLTINFGGSPCVFPFAQFSGVAIYRPELKRLDAGVVHASRTQAIAFAGIKN